MGGEIVRMYILSLWARAGLGGENLAFFVYITVSYPPHAIYMQLLVN